jgi:hypothetical protein
MSKIAIESQAAPQRVSDINVDAPLEPSTALMLDRLSRTGFAEMAAETLKGVPESAGFVLSIEGEWGSGKSSALAMIEALLAEDRGVKSPVIVHFNPWLVGAKDALLRQFLTKIADALELSDPSGDGKKVAKEIKAYGKVFDLVKLVPGAEPWASIVQTVFKAAGEASGDIAEYKALDVEAFKNKVEQALRGFGRPVIVFIDDVDRLFPAEVFEMIRIIKAVGGLPSVGYVVAWDSSYVSDALQSLGVPQAKSYLDKVVQVRMPLPSLSLAARGKLLDEAMAGLSQQALKPRFQNHEKRLGFLYLSGLRDLLDQPRDIVRFFNAVRMMEPLLRDEIVLADILGLAALSTKAPAVFELLKKKPRLFIGRLPEDYALTGTSEKIIADGSQEREAAYDLSRSGNAAKRLVHFLFPDVAVAEDSRSLGAGHYRDGVISHPTRLIIALQLSITDGDVSIRSARSYLQYPGERASIFSKLTIETCNEFVHMLGEIGTSLRGEGIPDLSDLCVSITRLVDTPLFVERVKSHKTLFNPKSEDLVLEQIKSLAQGAGPEQIRSAIQAVATDSGSLTCAAEILRQSYLPCHNPSTHCILPEDDRERVLTAFSGNVIEAATAGKLFSLNRPGFILWTFARLVSEKCQPLMKALRSNDPTLDSFALAYFATSWDSSNGQAYGLQNDPELDIAFLSMDALKKHARDRTADTTLGFPARAVWEAIVSGFNHYGEDGSIVSR